MAIEFARVQYIKRSDSGNACRSAAYNARADLRCERTGERFYFAHRDGQLFHDVLLPSGADARFGDIEVLWNAAQAAEKRKDSQEAKELLLALPSNSGLDVDDWRELALSFADQHFVRKGVAVQVDFHAPHDGERNVHAHLLITTRRLDANGFSAAKARDLDPEIRTMKSGRQAVTEADHWGALWRDHQNQYFVEQGLDIRVDETGIVAQRHEGAVRMRAKPERAEKRAAAVEDANQDAIRDPEHLLEAVTRRHATFTELDLERYLRKYIRDANEREEFRRATLAHASVIALHERGEGAFAGRYTTSTVRDEESEVLRAARMIARPRDAVPERHRDAARMARTFDDEQERAYLKATGTDGLIVIEGVAGAGKSYSIDGIRDAHERAGWRVIGLAHTNSVADDLRRAGFAHGSTLTLELFYQENQRTDRSPTWDRRTCVIVDEAAMLDTKSYARLMRRAANSGAKVVLAGDDRQLASIERGGMFTELKNQHGSSLISRVRRQESDWQKSASEDFAAGRFAEGIRAYAEAGCVHWSGALEESRTRLLSDWDQDSRAHPEAKRFVYAATNAEVDMLNQNLRAIRARRGEVRDELAVETVRGRFEIGGSDRIQFFANDRRAGIYNGSLATVTAINGSRVTAHTDTGRDVEFDATSFTQFGFGYAGTVYRGQGKTETNVYALYDNAFAWNARSAYVGLTRHRNSMNLYVSRELATDETVLVRQMSRRSRDEASLTYATAAEVVSLSSVRARPTDAAIGPLPEKHGREPLPRDQFEQLRRVDLTAYAAARHGYTVHADPQRRDHYELTPPNTRGRPARLEVRRNPDGHWTYRNPSDPHDRGDILDFEKREGASDLAAARLMVLSYMAERGQVAETFKAPNEVSKPREAGTGSGQEDEARAAAKKTNEMREQAQTDAEEELESARLARARRQKLLLEEEQQKKHEQFLREEADRKARLDADIQQAGELEQWQLLGMEQVRPRNHQEFVSSLNSRSSKAREKLDIPGPDPRKGRGDQDAFPASAQLRYLESLATYYDPSNPYGSLARAALAEAAGFQRERFELDQKVALEDDPGRRDMLMLRREIEHADYLGQTWERIAGQSRAIGGETQKGEAVQQLAKADTFKHAARNAREDWESRAVQNSVLYPPLNDAMRSRIHEARQAREEAPSRRGQDDKAEKIAAIRQRAKDTTAQQQQPGRGGKGGRG